MKDRIVHIEWRDAAYNAGYYDKKSPEDFAPVKTSTTGHLVKKTSDSVIVSVDRFYDEKGKITDDRHISIIPKKMIVSMTYLGESDASRKR